MAVILIGPAGPGAGADWDNVGDGRRKRRLVRDRRMRDGSVIEKAMVVVVLVVENGGGELWGSYGGKGK